MLAEYIKSIFKKKTKFKKQFPTHLEKYKLQTQAKKELLYFLKTNCNNKESFNNYLNQIDLFIYEIPKLDLEQSIALISEIKLFLKSNKYDLDSSKKQKEFKELFSNN